LRKCCSSKPNDLVALVKKEKTCAVTTGSLRAFNVYILNQQQKINPDSTIDFNDATVQKTIAKDAVVDIFENIKQFLIDYSHLFSALSIAI